MGNWGFYPKDGDTALDIKSDIDDAVNIALGKIIQNNSKGKGFAKCEWDICGVIMILLQQGTFVDRKYLSKAVNWLKAFAKDEVFLDEWGENRSEVLEHIKKLTIAMEKLLKDTQTKHILAPRGWMLRDFEMKAGTSWSGLSELLKS